MFSPTGIDLITFDFDGTLASLTIDFAAMKRDVEGLALSMGLDWSVTDGLFLLEAIDVLTGNHSVRGREFAGKAFGVIEQREVAAAQKAAPFPQTKAVLKTLRSAGYKIAVITRNCRRAVETVLPDLATRVDLFLSREDVAKPKPHADHMHKVLETMGVGPNRCLVVGDHPIDIKTARAVGAWACGVHTGRMGPDDLKEADLVCASLDNLVEYMCSGE